MPVMLLSPMILTPFCITVNLRPTDVMKNLAVLMHEPELHAIGW
jgi:hypothetical protein